MSDASSRVSGRISIDTSLHEFYKELSDGSDPEKTPFRSMKDIFMLAACLGYQRGQARPIAGSKRQIFHWQQFSAQVDEPILKAIAIATTGDIQVLSDQERIIQIAEEFANAGIEELRLQIVDHPEQPLWALISLLRTM